MGLFTVPAPFCVIMVAFLLTLISSSFGVSQSLLSSICSQTENQEICENILLSDPRTSSANLSQLSLISLELAMKQVDKNYQTFSRFHENTTDPGLKSSLNCCVSIYKNMGDILQEAHKLSQKKQYKNITSNLGKLTTMAYNCENGMPSSSKTAAISEDMLLNAQTVASVNLYIAGP